jgi:hypothetical protein
VTSVLSVYDEVRRPIDNDVVEHSLKLGFLYKFHSEYVPTGTDIGKLYAGDPEELSKVFDEVMKNEVFIAKVHRRTTGDAQTTCLSCAWPGKDSHDLKKLRLFL